MRSMFGLKPKMAGRLIVLSAVGLGWSVRHQSSEKAFCLVDMAFIGLSLMKICAS